MHCLIAHRRTLPPTDDLRRVVDSTRDDVRAAPKDPLAACGFLRDLALRPRFVAARSAQRPQARSWVSLEAADPRLATDTMTGPRATETPFEGAYLFASDPAGTVAR